MKRFLCRCKTPGIYLWLFLPVRRFRRPIP